MGAVAAFSSKIGEARRYSAASGMNTLIVLGPLFAHWKYGRSSTTVSDAASVDLVALYGHP
jgi:hypothetical protein